MLTSRLPQTLSRLSLYIIIYRQTLLSVIVICMILVKIVIQMFYIRCIETCAIKNSNVFLNIPLRTENIRLSIFSWGVWAPRMSVLPQDRFSISIVLTPFGYQSNAGLGHQPNLHNTTVRIWGTSLTYITSPWGDPLLLGNLVSNCL